MHGCFVAYSILATTVSGIRGRIKERRGWQSRSPLFNSLSLSKEVLRISQAVATIFGQEADVDSRTMLDNFDDLTAAQPRSLRKNLQFFSPTMILNTIKVMDAKNAVASD